MYVPCLACAYFPYQILNVWFYQMSCPCACLSVSVSMWFSIASIYLWVCSLVLSMSCLCCLVLSCLCVLSISDLERYQCHVYVCVCLCGWFSIASINFFSKRPLASVCIGRFSPHDSSLFQLLVTSAQPPPLKSRHRSKPLTRISIFSFGVCCLLSTELGEEPICFCVQALGNPSSFVLFGDWEIFSGSLSGQDLVVRVSSRGWFNTRLQKTKDIKYRFSSPS